MLIEASALVLLLVLITYGVLGGADFGGGVWDALASGPRKHVQRVAISHAMGPVWEANHVWLIFVIVLLFSNFPHAFAVLSVAFFVPFHLVLLGITARGVAFSFRSHLSATSAAPSLALRALGAMFGAASALTPALLGACLGAVSTGRIHANLQDPVHAVRLDGIPWLAPFALSTAAAALSLCAFTAAVFLTTETDGDLREDFRKRALITWVIIAVGASGTLPLARLLAPHLFAALFNRAWPVLLAGAVAAVTAGYALLIRRFLVARAAAVAEVVFLLFGWGVAQFPHIVYPDVTLYNAAAGEGTLRFVLWSLCPGLALLVPSLWFLFRVFKRQGPEGAA